MGQCWQARGGATAMHTAGEVLASRSLRAANRSICSKCRASSASASARGCPKAATSALMLETERPTRIPTRPAGPQRAGDIATCPRRRCCVCPSAPAAAAGAGGAGIPGGGGMGKHREQQAGAHRAPPAAHQRQSSQDTIPTPNSSGRRACIPPAPPRGPGAASILQASQNEDGRAGRLCRALAGKSPLPTHVCKYLPPPPHVFARGASAPQVTCRPCLACRSPSAPIPRPTQHKRQQAQRIGRKARGRGRGERPTDCRAAQRRI